jgi:hypothetical protein
MTPGGADGRGGCFPGPANTGIPEGTVLTTYTGPCTITVANTVIDAKIVSCDLDVQATGLLIKRSHVKGSILGAEGFAMNLRIEDSWLDNGVCVDCGVGYDSFIILRTEITGSNRGAYCRRTCLIQDSWIHGTALDPNSQWHASAVRVEQGANLVHNTLACDWTGPFNNSEIGCSADMTGYPDFAPIKNNTIDGNLFMANPIGLGFCAYGGGTSGKPYSNDPTDATYITFRNNVFQRGSNRKCGAYGAITDFIAGRTGNVWTNNIWDDGAVVIGQ